MRKIQSDHNKCVELQHLRSTQIPYETSGTDGKDGVVNQHTIISGKIWYVAT